MFLHDVWVQDGIAYLSYWDAGLVLLDVSDPANPVFLGDSTYPNPDASGLPPEGNGHVAVPNAAGDLVIFGDEDTARISGFLDSTIGGSPGTNKIGFANFGPSALTSFPTDVVAVAANVGCNAGDFGTTSVAGEVVLIERGACFFSTKAENAEAAGYGGYIVFNSEAGGDGLINMAAGTPGPFNIPGIFITRTLGLAMKGELVPGPGTVTADSVAGIPDGEGFMRVIDVSDPANMVEVGQYYTERTLPPANLTAAGGTRDAHNVVVDGTGSETASPRPSPTALRTESHAAIAARVSGASTPNEERRSHGPSPSRAMNEAWSAAPTRPSFTPGSSSRLLNPKDVKGRLTLFDPAHPLAL